MYNKYILNPEPKDIYTPKLGDRVKYSTGPSSTSWKVTRTGMAGGRIQIANQLTGKLRTIKASELSGRYKGETWVDISRYSGIKFAYDANGDGVISNKDGGAIRPTYTVAAKTSSGKFILKSSNGSNNIWIDTDKLKRYIGNGKPLSSYNTGGYTGQWPNGSTEGRWALLHQKELILNEQDTPKILDAVKLVREITTGSIISDMQDRMNNLISNLVNDLIGTYVKLEAAAGSMYSDGQTLEQQVHIDATFPNVKDAKEIEAALNNLVNVASQYATEDK